MLTARAGIFTSIKPKRTRPTILAWGNNTFGQLGTGTNISTNVPVQVPGLSGVSAVDGGGAANGFSLALKNDGTVMSWGYNGEGQLGNGTNSDSYVPVQVTGLSGISNIACGSSGKGFSLALQSAGTVMSWGG
jgi:alpha-tubulin suppressor-like RCC1 family protein